MNEYSFRSTYQRFLKRGKLLIDKLIKRDYQQSTNFCMTPDPRRMFVEVRVCSASSLHFFFGLLNLNTVCYHHISFFHGYLNNIK